MKAFLLSLSFITFGCQTSQPYVNRSISSAAIEETMVGRHITFNFDAKLTVIESQKLYSTTELPRDGKYDMIESHCLVSFGPVLKGEAWEVIKVESGSSFSVQKNIYLEHNDKKSVLECSYKGLSAGRIAYIELTWKAILMAFKGNIQIN